MELKKCLLLLLIFPSISLRAQQLVTLTENHDYSLRGLSAVNDEVIWVSGSNGTVGLSVNGGDSWRWMTVTHFEKTDFRDVEAFSDKEAIIMGVTEPAVILKTMDGGQSWRTVFRDSAKGMFLDAMDFHGAAGVLIGDPTDRKIFLAQTNDQGEHWQTVTPGTDQTPVKGESFFASSGSNISHFPAGGRFAFVSGGAAAAFYTDSLQRIPLAIKQGAETTGANSIAFGLAEGGLAIVVGGDFRKDSIPDSNCVIIHLRTLAQTIPIVAPHGYRSCVAFAGGNDWITCGTSGVDWSADNGNTWKQISTQGFHVCGKSKAGQHIFLAGAQGRVAVVMP